MIKRLQLPHTFGVVLAAAIAACGSHLTPSGLGIAALEIHATRGECYSFACAYIARLDGPDGIAEAGFVAFDGPDLSLVADFPAVLSEGDYQLTFEVRSVSDLLNTDGSRDLGMGAACHAGFKVGPGRSHIMVRVTFGVDTCALSLDTEQVEPSVHPTTKPT